MRYRTIYADCPWDQGMVGRFAKTRNNRPRTLPYPTMTLDQIKDVPVPDLADRDCHLWLWTTNQFLPAGFDLMAYWGFRYLCPITWVKPSGCGAWWVHRTQTLLMGYRGKLDMRERLKPNVVFAPAKRHSQKPAEFYDLIEAVSHPARVELYARATRPGWVSLGNEIDGRDITAAVRGAA